METRPPVMMFFFQAFQAMILPAVAIPVFILINNKKLMGKNAAGLKMNIGIMSVILFSFVISYFAIIELF